MSERTSDLIDSQEMRNVVHIIQRSVFLNMYLDLLEYTSKNIKHTFIIYGNDWHQGLESYPEYESKYRFINIQSPDSHLDIKYICSSEVRKVLHKSNMIIIHALHAETIAFLLFHPSMLHKSILRVWGEELLYQKYSSVCRRIIQHIKYIVKKLIVRNIKYIISTNAEYNIIKKYYNPNAVHIRGAMTYKYSSLTADLPLQPPVNIVVGHSGFETGKHIEALNILRRFRDEDINIYIPISYGGKDEYIAIIKEFTDKNFRPGTVHILTEFMDIEKYESLLRKVHIGIYNAENQTGLGNISILLSNGAKIYFNQKGLNVRIIRERGYICHTISEIESMNFSDFIKLDEESQNHNINNYMIENNEDKKIIEWNNVFSMDIKG